MGTSEHWQIPKVIENVMRIQPKSVLDVGAGWGKYGLLVREYAPVERVDMLDVSPPRYDVYDHVYQGTVLEADRLLPADAPVYDLALFVEVIEHLEKEDGWKALEVLTRRARQVIVTTPLGFRPQEFEGLPYETHRSGWYPWEIGKRFKVLRTMLYPGHYTRFLHLPSHWQFLVVVTAR